MEIWKRSHLYESAPQRGEPKISEGSETVSDSVWVVNEVWPSPRGCFACLVVEPKLGQWRSRA